MKALSPDEEPTLLIDTTTTGSLRLPILNPRRAQPFPWQRLPRLAASTARSLDALAAFLPGPLSMENLATELAADLEALLDLPHRIRWTGFGLVTEDLEELPLDDGVFSWATFPPCTGRLLVGVQSSLAKSWLEALGQEFLQAPQEERDGAATLVLAEVIAGLGRRAGWPLLSWGLTTVPTDLLPHLLITSEPPLLELLFTVENPRARGLLRLWFPAAVVRHLHQALSLPAAEELLPRFAGLSITAPLFAARARLTRRCVDELRPGDVLLLQDHGILRADTESHDPRAFWQFRRSCALQGTLRADAQGTWRFKTASAVHCPYQGEDPVNPQENSTQPLASIAHDSLVEVRVQVGSITLELGQLARLRPGQILDCDRPAGSVVDLVVSGTVVARGELVVVDDRLGVRVLTAPRS